ncbi:hypothetical protein CHU98_g7451 [Xylaria longipes]|nr:hypothetical protein CHU98_g7451 [Xylaria longipes]
MQNAGISSSHTVTYGAVGDLFTPAERGGYSGIVSFFLSAISPLCLVLMVLFLPEMSRRIVGGGALLPDRVNRAFIQESSPLSPKSKKLYISESLEAFGNAEWDIGQSGNKTIHMIYLSERTRLLIVEYSWLLQYRVDIAALLVYKIQFFIGLSIQRVLTALSMLLVDIHPDALSTAQSASNLIQAELAAGGLALLDIILRGVGTGLTFVLRAVISLFSVPWLHALQLKGLKWRHKK